MSVQKTNISSNVAYYGGAIVTSHGASVNLSNVHLNNNYAGGFGAGKDEGDSTDVGGGGALMFAESAVYISYSTLADNNVKDGDGGAILFVDSVTLAKILPPPVRRIIGDLSDREKVLIGLDLLYDELTDTEIFYSSDE